MTAYSSIKTIDVGIIDEMIRVRWKLVRSDHYDRDWNPSLTAFYSNRGDGVWEIMSGSLGYMHSFVKRTLTPEEVTKLLISESVDSILIDNLKINKKVLTIWYDEWLDG